MTSIDLTSDTGVKIKHYSKLIYVTTCEKGWEGGGGGGGEKNCEDMWTALTPTGE